MQINPEQTAQNAVEVALVAKPSQAAMENVTANAIGSPDYIKADIQFYNYCTALEECGAELIISTEMQNLDVNKLAVITDSFAIIGNFDKNSAEYASLKETVRLLATKRFLKFITAPGLLSASDVLKAGNQFFINLTDNTNEEGASQLAFFLASSGYEPIIIDNLNINEPLSSMAVYLGNNQMLIDKKLAKNVNFIGFEQIVVSSLEKGATHAAMINGTLLIGAGFTNTMVELKAKNIAFKEVNISELEKTGLSVKSMSLTMPMMQSEVDVSNISVTSNSKYTQQKAA